MTFKEYKENAKTNSCTITEEEFVKVCADAMHQALPAEALDSLAIVMSIALVQAEMNKMMFHSNDAEGKEEKGE